MLGVYPREIKEVKSTPYTNVNSSFIQNCLKLEPKYPKGK